MARLLIRDSQDQEEVVQLCIVDILRGGSGFRGDSSLETWAHRIAVRRAMKFRSKRRLVIVAEDEASDPAEVATPEEDSPLMDRLPRSVTAYLAELPEAQRQAIVLHHAWGYSLAEIAKLTGKSPNTVKTRLFHGMRRVRSMIAADVRGKA